MSKQQTAVEWLIHQLNTRQKPLDNSQIDELFEQAKAMEKEQIMQSHIDGFGYIVAEFNKKKYAEQYYNITYNK